MSKEHFYLIFYFLRSFKLISEIIFIVIFNRSDQNFLTYANSTFI